MRAVPVTEVILDFDLYPRASVDPHHLNAIYQAIQFGAELPPIVICKKSRKVADGFHRVQAYLRAKRKTIEVIEKTYRNAGELFLDAMRYNATHGRILTSYDRTHCALRAEQLGLEMEQVASALSMTQEAMGLLRTDRVGRLRATDPANGHREVAIKRTIRHMAGKSLTKAQFEANEVLGGMEATFYVNQLITLISNGLLDTENEVLMEKLGLLKTLLNKAFKGVSK